MPYTSATKLTFDSGEFAKVMDLCMDKADWKNFNKRRRESARRGLLPVSSFCDSSTLSI